MLGSWDEILQNRRISSTEWQACGTCTIPCPTFRGWGSGAETGISSSGVFLSVDTDCVRVTSYDLVTWHWIHKTRIDSLHINKFTSTLYTTRKPSYRWQTRATWKSAKNCSNSTCLQHCRWRYWPMFIRLAVVAFEICEIPRNSLKFKLMEFKVIQGHRSWCQWKAHMWLHISH